MRRSPLHSGNHQELIQGPFPLDGQSQSSCLQGSCFCKQKVSGTGSESSTDIASGQLTWACSQQLPPVCNCSSWGSDDLIQPALISTVLLNLPINCTYRRAHAHDHAHVMDVISLARLSHSEIL